MCGSAWMTAYRLTKPGLIAARFGPLQVVNTYVPQGRAIEHAMYQYKLQWFERLQKWFDRHFTPKTLLVWVGDLNVAPEAKDIHNADQQAKHVCYHQAVREAFERTKAWGFEDVFRKYHPEGGQYTFFDYRTANALKRNMGWRVDHIMATPPLANKSRDSYIDLSPRLKPKAYRPYRDWWRSLRCRCGPMPDAGGQTPDGVKTFTPAS